jgi:hypothetical protein
MLGCVKASAQCRSCHGRCVIDHAGEALGWAITRRARLARNPVGSDFKLRQVGFVTLGKGLEDFIADLARGPIGRNDLNIISETGIQPPTQRRQPSDPFGRENMSQGRLQQSTGRFASQHAVSREPALNVFVAVPHSREAVFTRTIQSHYVGQRGFDPRLNWGRFGIPSVRPSRQHQQERDARRTIKHPAHEYPPQDETRAAFVLIMFYARLIIAKGQGPNEGLFLP